MAKITAKQVREELSTILDPEIGVDIVGLGLIYNVSVSVKQTARGTVTMVHILMTLTTPGCPLATTIEDMIHRQLDTIEGLDGYRDVIIEITFDPPWTQDMMSLEVQAELGFS
jgi:metal-sulfur cluster biosynthetic enzyme